MMGPGWSNLRCDPLRSLFYQVTSLILADLRTIHKIPTTTADSLSPLVRTYTLTTLHYISANTHTVRDLLLSSLQVGMLADIAQMASQGPAVFAQQSAGQAAASLGGTGGGDPPEKKGDKPGRAHEAESGKLRPENVSADLCWCGKHKGPHREPRLCRNCGKTHVGECRKKSKSPTKRGAVPTNADTLFAMGDAFHNMGLRLLQGHGVAGSRVAKPGSRGGRGGRGGRGDGGPKDDKGKGPSKPPGGGQRGNSGPPNT